MSNPTYDLDAEVLWERHSEAVQILEDAGDWTSVMRRQDFLKAVQPLIERIASLESRTA